MPTSGPATTWVPLHPAVHDAGDISDSGVVVGSRSISRFSPRTAVRYDLTTGDLTDLGSLGYDGSLGYESHAAAINESGVIVGSSLTDWDPKDPPTHPFVWDPITATIRDVGTLTTSPTCNAALVDVNEDGIAVGSSCYDPRFVTGQKMHAVTYDIDADEMTDLGTLGGDESSALAIADDGAVVGESNLVDGGPSHAFYRSPGGGPLEDLGTLPGHTVSAATGINPSGSLVAGWSAPDDTLAGRDQARGFVYDMAADTMTDIGTLGGAMSTATDVNDAGLVAGTSTTAAGDERGALYDTASSVLVDTTTLGSGGVSSLTALNASGSGVGSALFPTLGGWGAAALLPWTFADVPPWHVFAADIEWTAAEDIAHGWPDAAYRPTGLVTRQAMAAFLHRLAGSPPIALPPTPTFVDVGVDDPFYAEVEWLATTDIATGYPGSTYRPTRLVTRQAMAAFLYRLAGAPSFAPPAARTFPDVPPTHPFYVEIEWAAAQQLTTGYEDGDYRPGWAVMRQAMAAFMHRYADGPGVG